MQEGAGMAEDFGRYWVAGLIMAVATGFINTLTYIIGTWRPNFYPEWILGLLTGIAGIAMFILVPWIYGRLVELVYIHFISGEG
ncbi:MAG: hypothetical protein PWP32_1433 [Methanothermobacter sp.]|jgi:zinc transporter ZupT|uniref:Uncharacterized protein n=2 Tax=Methanothermobacter TaxID=145260 RepID=A0A371NDR3_9EURY|nr:hypothetical protein [Methanothermobacter defluvii]MDN5374668.1 hypothetical protein [Methanothermobacter sp.]REE28642.1 hypothetical protein C7452_0662 [Methanothermobacter defluvii]